MSDQGNPDLINEGFMFSAPESCFGVHSDYVARVDPVHFDDRAFKDEWQDEVYRQAQKIFREQNYGRVLDFGCGSGFKLTKYFEPAQTIGVELEPAYSFLSAKYPDRLWFSVLSDAAKQGPIDMIICSDVIEHVINPSILLDSFREMDCSCYIISTSSLELMADKGWSPRYGPPRNRSHIREWTAVEFNSYISRFLNVVEHRITNLEQCTQMIVAGKQDIALSD